MKGVAIFAMMMLAGCVHSGVQTTTLRMVTLPDGAQIGAEVELTAAEMQKGMMYRTSLPSDHGMLFVHQAPGNYPYWMANCRIPLDIIWMDSNHAVVEISANTPPCPEGGSGCATYGGNAVAAYVLELGGGEAARHNIRQGSTLKF